MGWDGWVGLGLKTKFIPKHRANVHFISVYNPHTESLSYTYFQSSAFYSPTLDLGIFHFDRHLTLREFCRVRVSESR